MEDEYDKNNNKNDIIEENAQKNKLKKAEEELVEIKHKLEESELNNLIYTHSIYKNRNRISEFLDKINNSEWKIRDKVI